MKDFIPAPVRQMVYGCFAVLGVVLGAMQVGFASADVGQPLWLTVSLAVYAFLGTAIGFTARANTVRLGSASDEIDAERIAGR